MKTRLAIIIGILLVIAFGVLVAQEDTVVGYYLPTVYEYDNVNMMESMPDLKLNTYYFYINPLVAMYADGEWGFNIYGLSIKEERGVKTEKVVIENTGRLEMKIEAWEVVGYPDYTIKEGYRKEADIDPKVSLEMKKEYYASVYGYWYSQGFTPAESKERADKETGGAPISNYPEGYADSLKTKDENDPYWVSLRNVWIKRGFDATKAGEFATLEIGDPTASRASDGNNDKVIDFTKPFNKRKIYFYIKDATFFLLKDNKLVEKVTGADLKLKTEGTLEYRLKLNPTRIVMIEDLHNFMGGYFETTTVPLPDSRTNDHFVVSGRLTPDFIRIRDAAFYPSNARRIFKNLPGKFSVEEYKRTIANLTDIRGSLVVKTWSANKIIEKDGDYYDKDGKEVTGYAGVLKYLKDNKVNNPFLIENPIADQIEGLRNVQRAFFGYQFNTPIERVPESTIVAPAEDTPEKAAGNWTSKFKAMTALGAVDIPVDVPLEITVTSPRSADGKYLATMKFTFGTTIVTLNDVEIKKITVKDKDGNIVKNADGTDLVKWGFEGAEATVDATFFQFFSITKDTGVIIFNGFFNNSFDKIMNPGENSIVPYEVGGIIMNKEDNSVLAKWSASK